MKLWVAEILNAFIVALISFVGQLIYYGWPPTADRLYLSTLIGIMAFLTLCLKLVKKLQERLRKKNDPSAHPGTEFELHTTKKVIMPKKKNNSILSLWFT